MSAGYTYTEADKARIKANPLNRANCVNIRAITTRYYREMQAAERGIQLATTDKARKEALNNHKQSKRRVRKEPF